MKNCFLYSLLCLLPAGLFAQTVIGVTSYDVQTNNGAKHRIQVNPDGTISAAWTGSMDFSGALSFTDRGMFYNHYDGAAWGGWPAARVETVRTGFGEVIRVEDHEVMLSHDGVLGIQLFANTAIGGTTFTELSGSDDIPGFWPAAYCPEGTNDIYVVNANANPPTELQFSRSDDGGLTWSVLDYTLPFLTVADGFPGLNTGIYTAAETYQVAVYGTNVYVLIGMVNSDLLLLHSASNGAPGTWTSTTLIDLPLTAWNGLTQTDVDGDFITDVIETTDGYHNMFIDNAGTVQIFSGYVKVFNDGLGAYWTYDWNDAMKMWHWHTGMPAATTIDLTLDWNNADGLGDPDAGIGAFRSHYRSAGLTSMPGACKDNITGKLYLLYTMPIEYTDDYGDPANLSAQSRRDIFGVTSEDGGATWSAPVNLTNSAESGHENVFPSVFSGFALDRVHAIWQEDIYPGTAITDFDPVDTNHILYQAFEEADFGEVAVVCNTATGPGGLFVSDLTPTGATLNWDSVALADQYVVAFWNAAAPETVGKRRPSENFFVIGEGKLSPETTYGFRVKTVCFEEGTKSPYSETVYFTTPPLRQGEFSPVVHIYPNPNAGLFTISLSGYAGQDAQVQIVNAVGQLVYARNLTSAEHQTALQVDLQGVPTGMYHVLVFSAGVTTTETLIID